MTRTLMVTLEHEDARQVQAATQRLFDGLRWLQPAVTYRIEAHRPSAGRATARVYGLTSRVCCAVCRREMDSLVSWRHRQIDGVLCKPCYDHATAE